jgi:hypothetical protein
MAPPPVDLDEDDPFEPVEDSLLAVDRSDSEDDVVVVPGVGYSPQGPRGGGSS